MENPNEMDADLGVALFQETSKSQYDRLLVGGLKHLLFFPYVGFLIIPTDFHIFQRGGSTTNQRYLLHVNLFSHEPYSYWPYPICHSGNLQIILFNGIFHDKPSVFGDPHGHGKPQIGGTPPMAGKAQAPDPRFAQSPFSAGPGQPGLGQRCLRGGGSGGWEFSRKSWENRGKSYGNCAKS